MRVSPHWTVLISLVACGTDPGPGASPSTLPQDGTPRGLPCDIAEVFANECDTCHFAGGIEPSLATRDHLLVDTPSNPGTTVAEEALARMQNTADPMPPGGASAASIAIVQAWVDAGMPAGECGSHTDAPPNPFDDPPTCSSGTTWTNGDEGDVLMHPGRACNACHATEKPERVYAIAGTVYPTGHEPDECFGLDDVGLVVEVTDADGKIFKTSPNAAGNFFIEREHGNIAYPATVKVISERGQRAMNTALAGPNDADCNGCHTQDGARDAPGRIVAPY